MDTLFGLMIMFAAQILAVLAFAGLFIGPVLLLAFISKLKK